MAFVVSTSSQDRHADRYLRQPSVRTPLVPFYKALCNFPSGNQLAQPVAASIMAMQICLFAVPSAKGSVLIL